MRCPSCGGRCIGRVGIHQYYCWDCCVEFCFHRGTVRIYQVDAEGELVAMPACDPAVGEATQTLAVQRP